jgi:hypothetical protein
MKNTFVYFFLILARITNENFTFETGAKGVIPLETHAAADLVLAVIVFRKQTGAEYALIVLDIT